MKRTAERPIRIEYTHWFASELEVEPVTQQWRIFRRLQVLERKTLSQATWNEDIKELEDGIWELRVVGRGPAYRLLFFLAPGRRPHLVVLTSCVKKAMFKKAAIRRSEILRAVDLRTQWLLAHKETR